MTDELISFATSKLANQAGFDIPCYNTFDVIDGRLYSNMNSIGGMVDTYNRPTQSLLQRWLREVHQVYVEATSRLYNDVIVHIWDIYWDKIPKDEVTDDEIPHATYELALEAALQEALKLLINTKQDDNIS